MQPEIAPIVSQECPVTSQIRRMIGMGMPMAHKIIDRMKSSREIPFR